ncbi:unknown [Firmicutes bacterium CAG:791]|nr:unknown [Firmicutes bacterium CAG:791]
MLRNGGHRFHRSARIVSKIHDQSLHSLILQLLKLLSKLLRGHIVKLRNLQIADLILKHFPGNRLRMHFLSGHIKFHFLAVANDSKVDHRSFFSLDPTDRHIKLQILKKLSIRLPQNIVCLKTRFFCRGPRDDPCYFRTAH